MVTFVKGNILDSPAQAIVNTVNTVGVMGKGLALQFKEAYPENYVIYRQACKSGLLNPGMVLVTEAVQLDGTTKLIVNFPTKTDWRKPSEYSYIESGLIALRNEILVRGIQSIAIPPLGSRNGGLNWNIVKEMIVSQLADLDCGITIYEPTADINERLRKEKVSLTPARAMMLDVMVDMVAHGEFVSEFAAEKIAYFLQRFGAEDVFKLRFQKGVYGPYSGKVRFVLHYLNGSYIMGMSDFSKRPFDEIGITADARLASGEVLGLDSNRKYAEISCKTKKFLSRYYSNFSLELLSTVDFLLSTDSEFSGWKKMDSDILSQAMTNRVSEWNEHKRRYFNKPEYVQIMLNHLRESELY